MVKSQSHAHGRLNSLGHATTVNPNKTQSQAVNFLRVLSILAVLLIHTTTRHLEAVHYDFALAGTALFLNQVSRFAVPLFFLISGFVLELNFRPGLGQYYQKRFSRILLPYLAWSALYYFVIYTDHHSSSFLSALITGSASYQLYFIPSLILLYLAFPFLRSLLKFPVLVPIFFVLQLYLLRLDYQLAFPSLPYPLAVAIFNFFPFYYGMFVAKKNITLVHPLLYLLPLTWIANVVFKEGRQGYLHSWNIHYFYSQWRPSVLFYSLLVFHFFTSLESYIKRLPYLDLFSSLSFCVFFVHVLVLELVWKYLGVFIYKYPGFDLFFFSIIVSVSFLVAYFCRKLPLLSKLTG